MNVIIGHVHTARIDHLIVNDHNLAVVAMPGMIQIRKHDGVEHLHVDMAAFQLAQMAFPQRAVVAHVAEVIVNDPHLHPFARLLVQQREQGTAYGVVAKIEIFKIHVAFRRSNVGKQVLKLFRTARQQPCLVIRGKLHPIGCQIGHHQRVAPHRLATHHPLHEPTQQTQQEPFFLHHSTTPSSVSAQNMQLK